MNDITCTRGNYIHHTRVAPPPSLFPSDSRDYPTSTKYAKRGAVGGVQIRVNIGAKYDEYRERDKFA